MLNPNIRPKAACSNDKSPLAQSIDSLVAAGFGNYLRPVPPPDVLVQFKAGEKKSSGKTPARFDGRWLGWPGWQEPRTITKAEVGAWRQWPDAGLCLVLGDVVAIDIDIKIPTVDSSFHAQRARSLVRKIGEIVASEVGCAVDRLPTRTRRGTSSKVILLRAAAEFSKSKIAFGDDFAIELLARGQQVVVAGRHKSGELQTTTLVEHGLDSLPQLSQEGFDVIWRRIREAIEADGYQVKQSAKPAHFGDRKKPTDRHGIIWSEVMRRRADWIPRLLPCSLERPAGEWRISSSELGRELEEDLAIFPDGIYDFGTERWHDALSLICEFGAVDEKGAVDFGGSPDYGPRGSKPYAVVGEPDEKTRRPSRQEAFAWLCTVLGNVAPSAGAELDDLARALGLSKDAINAEIATLWFEDQDNVVPISTPERWSTDQIKANRSRLPVLRAINPAGFEKLKEAWDAGFAMMPAEIDALIAEEMDRIRREPSSPELSRAQPANTPIKVAPGDADDEPIDLFGNADPGELGDLPSGALPLMMTRWVKSEARRKGVPEAFAAISAVTVFGAAIGAGIRIQVLQRDDSWTEAGNLWSVIVAPPGSAKSPIIAAGTAPLRAVNDKWVERDTAAHAQWAAASKRRGKEMPPAGPEPRIRRALVDDMTSEKAIRIFRDNPRGVLQAPDELAGLLGGFGAYKSGAGADRAHFLRTFDGGSIVSDRVGSGTISAKRAQLAVLSSTQPEKLRGLARDLGADGLLQRFMVVLHDGRERMQLDEEPDRQAADWFSSSIEYLSIAGDMSSEPVRLCPAAGAALTVAMDQIRSLKHSPGASDALRGHIEKWGKILPRLILIVHVMRTLEGETHLDARLPVEVDTVAMAVSLARLFLRHALAFYTSYFAGSASASEAVWIAGHLLVRPDLRTVTRRDIYDARKGLRGAENLRTLLGAMGELEMAGWCAVTNRDSSGPTTWQVNGRIHERFAEHADRERQARTEKRAKIAEAGRAREWLSGDEEIGNAAEGVLG